MIINKKFIFGVIVMFSSVCVATAATKNKFDVKPQYKPSEIAGPTWQQAISFCKKRDWAGPDCEMVYYGSHPPQIKRNNQTQQQ
jgi:hypothetical protein